MISFKEVKTVAEASAAVENCPEDILLEVVTPLVEEAEDSYSVAVCESCGCLLIRIFEGGEYAFLFPFEISAEADLGGAVKSLAAYATYQEIGELTILDIPTEMREIIENIGFNHVEYQVADCEGECFIAHVLTECALLDEVPVRKGKRLTLDELTDGDKEAYSAICKDLELNKYWGYDYREDAPGCDGIYFIEEARREFNTTSAVTLAVREGGTLVGDVVIYGFDYFGNAAAGVRIAREYQGQGYGKEASEIMFSLAKDMGLKCIRAVIMNKNIPSLSLYSKMMVKVNESEEKSYFEKYL